jgi:hypothetical protein
LLAVPVVFEQRYIRYRYSNISVALMQSCVRYSSCSCSAVLGQSYVRYSNWYNAEAELF